MKVGLTLGSNVGDRLRHLQTAKRYLISLSTAHWHCASPVYETEPVDCVPESPRFLNAVLEIECDGAPRSLLEKILAYELAHGRDRSSGVNSPRTIDIDILYFGDQTVVEPDLMVPHPRLAQRRFVLLPLSTMQPELIVPGTGKTVAALLRELPGRSEDVKLLQQEW